MPHAMSNKLMTKHTGPETPSDANPQSIAESVGSKLYASDAVVRSLGIKLESIGPGRAQLQMAVRPDMINGAGICHGGIITTLADAAFAFACNSYNTLTLATGLSVEFLAPAQLGDVLTADAYEVSRTGRTGIYDVVVANRNNKRVALLRGRCHEIRGKHVLSSD